MASAEDQGARFEQPGGSPPPSPCIGQQRLIVHRRSTIGCEHVGIATLSHGRLRGGEPGTGRLLWRHRQRPGLPGDQPCQYLSQLRAPRRCDRRSIARKRDRRRGASGHEDDDQAEQRHEDAGHPDRARPALLSMSPRARSGGKSTHVAVLAHRHARDYLLGQELASCCAFGQHRAVSASTRCLRRSRSAAMSRRSCRSRTRPRRRNGPRGVARID